jgi:hypothetical protein
MINENDEYDRQESRELDLHDSSLMRCLKILHLENQAHSIQN